MIVVLIVAATILAGAGVYVYQTKISKQKSVPAPTVQHQKTQTLATQTPKAQEPQNSQTGEIDTFGWQIYKNEEWGFEFKYPKDWILEAKKPNNKNGFLDIHLANLAVLGDAKCDPNYVGMEIQAGIKKEKAEDFTTFVKSQMDCGLGCASGKTEKIEISGHNAAKAQYSGGDSKCLGPGYFIEQNENSYIYIFSGFGKNKEKEFSAIIDKIISTFNFIGPQAKYGLSASNPDLLKQLFPGSSLEIIKGHQIRRIEGDRIIEGDFISRGEKTYLLIAQSSGDNLQGYQQKYLGIFDKNGILQTSPVPSAEIPASIEVNPPHFGDDQVDFQTYDCGGITYIFAGTKQCLTGGATMCVESNDLLYKISGGKFEVVQDLKKEFFESQFEKSPLSLAVGSGIRLYEYKKINEVGNGFDIKCADKNKCLEIAHNPQDGDLYAVFYKEIPFDYGICKFRQ